MEEQNSPQGLQRLDCAQLGPSAMTATRSSPEPQLLSRIIVTWIELTIVGLAGGILGPTVGGPLGLIAYLVTTLISVGVLFYNINELIERRIIYK